MKFLNMKRWMALNLLLVVFISVSCTSSNKLGQSGKEPNRTTAADVSAELNVPWAFDPGPDPNTPMGKELIDIVSTQPFMPGISRELYFEVDDVNGEKVVKGDQKFRPAFGPTLWRMIQKPDSLKILFIGQDGTHIAEAAGRTATAGFGGRAQDLADHFGVRTGAAFINTFAFTIKGQYSVFGAPIIMDNGGSKTVNYGTVTENAVWLMAQDQNSPMVKWRNRLIDWIIRNNKNSLKMIVLFGGSAKDSIGTFIESRGGKVGTSYTAESIKSKKLEVPTFYMTGAGGNNEFPVVLNKDGGDIMSQLAGKSLNYKKEPDQALGQKALKENIASAYNDLILSKSGVGGSGLVHPAQLGGYKLDKISINGNNTISLNGLSLSDGSKILSDILVVDFPHPTALSSTMMEQGKEAVADLMEKEMEVLIPFAKKGWSITADSGMVNKFDQYVDASDSEKAQFRYEYGRTDLPQAYYDLGTPKNRMVAKSDAKRLDANTVILGTRLEFDNMFDMAKVGAAVNAPKPAGIPDGEMPTARPRLPETRYLFDRGPTSEIARVMINFVDMKLIGIPKQGMDPNKDFINAFNIKTDPEDVGPFGYYRGTFDSPRVIILADPDGLDDMVTSRALTGTRGQYLHGLMQDFGIGDKYLVIKTVPFGMDGATAQEWKTVMAQTKQYRKELFAILMRNKPELVIADGDWAATEIKDLSAGVKRLNIKRVGTENNSGLKEAAVAINQATGKNVTPKLEMANIPRTHLGFFSRVWEGTGGTHVFDSTMLSGLDKEKNKNFAMKGTAFAVVTPKWAEKFQTQQSVEERSAIEALKKTRDQILSPRPGEKFEDFKSRVKSNGGNAKFHLDFPWAA